MYKKILSAVILIIAVLSQVGCNDQRLSPESKELLQELNKETPRFESKSDIQSARTVIINSLSRNLSEIDSLVMVESVEPTTGLYQCVSYTSHNKMITFYNATKKLDDEGSYRGEYIQSPGETTPYDALTFIDTYQNGTFDQYYQNRNKEETNQNAKQWLISFIAKEGNEYQIKSILSN